MVIDEQLLNSVSAQAKASPRLRMNFLLPSVTGREMPSDAECRRTRNGGTHPSAPNSCPTSGLNKPTRINLNQLGQVASNLKSNKQVFSYRRLTVER